MEPSLKALGAAVRAQQDHQLAGSVDLDAGRQRLLAETKRRARPVRRIAFAIATGGAVLGLTAVVLVYRAGPLRFEVGTRGAGEVGAWIAAPGHDSEPLRFADGTELVLLPGARSLVEGTRAAPRVVVERGEIRASVRPAIGRRWRLDAGPFHVVVTGTKFSLAWDPEREHFSLALHEGSVLVSGPRLGADRAVAAGQTLRVTARDETAAHGIADPPVAPSERPREPLPEPPSAGVAEMPSTGTRARPQAATRGTPVPALGRYARLALENRYVEALAAAEAEGFERVCQTGAAPDLVLLGDAARLAGSTDRAQAAYAAVRERFGGAPAAHATFLLGRLALDERGDPKAAARLFEAYLRDNDGGPFAREASGLLAEARSRAGQHTAARAAAAAYLERYPDGPFAGRARALQGDE
jgi:TolA-binding protein